MSSNSTSSSRVGLVPSDPGRSTTDILFSCLSIFLLCTWSCLHMNLPSIEESEAGWHTWHSIPYWPERPLWRKWRRNVGWMIGIIIAPECGVAVAMRDWLAVREAFDEEGITASLRFLDQPGRNMDRSLKVMGEEGRQIGKSQFSNSHAFFANMGGFRYKIRYGRPRAIENIGRKDSELSVASTITESDAHADVTSEGIITNLSDLAQIQDMCQECHIPSEEDIRGLSKRDAVSKLFAIFQSSWLVIQCIARLCVGLPITELELATIAFAVCGIAMYALWWDKPYGVEHRYLIVGSSIHKPDTLLPAADGSGNPRAELGATRNRKTYDVIDFGKTRRWETGKRSPLGILLTCLLHPSSFPHIPSEIGGPLAFYVSGTLFSSFHILAWNWEFPSPLVRILWRAFAVMATAAAPTSAFIHSLPKWDCECSKGANAWMYMSLAIFSIVLAAVYVVARLGLIVIIFYCFSDMPAGVYQTVEWMNWFPYFG